MLQDRWAMWWSRWREGPYYRPSIVSIILHLTLLLLLSVNLLWATAPPIINMVQSGAQEPVIVQASVVSEQKYTEELKEVDNSQKQA